MLIGQIVLFACTMASSALAQQYTLLYNFTGNADGDTPAGTLIRDSQGNLYGTTQYGGNASGLAGHGTVFEYTASGQMNTLYAFTGNADGSNPFAGVVRDTQGNLYGTTPYGGTFTSYCAQGCGVVYEITSVGEELVRHSFEGSDGLFPMGGLFIDAQGYLYGTTMTGGSNGVNAGTVFSLSPGFIFGTIYGFEANRDGELPYAGVTIDNLGDIYGITTYGGEIGASVSHRSNGTVFEINRYGVKETPHTFSGGLDGAHPYGALAWSQKGGLYGTTSSGGKLGWNGGGTVFQMEPAGEEKIVHEFTGTPDGGYPFAGVTLDTNGNIYGTTYYGGEYGQGSVFMITPSGKETILHSFSGSDGAGPYGGLVLDGSGNIYGAAAFGGAYGAGTLFEIVQ
jgi:uncharacterized repeat protein (TIGR03803 family)